MSLEDLMAVRERISNELVVTHQRVDQGDEEAGTRVNGLLVAVALVDEVFHQRYPGIWESVPSPAEGVAVPRHWSEFTPEEAIQLALPRPDIRGPFNEEGQPCPWPWEPEQLTGASMGQYHCSYCGAMVMAGMRHPDYAIEGPL